MSPIRRRNGHILRQYYEAALERDPTNLQASAYLADAKMRMGLAKDAAALYGRALEQAPESLRMQLSLTMANVKAGHYGAPSP
jgi:tetratricopeptide (TPR) repeat protein